MGKPGFSNRIKNFFRIAGPGLITGASDDDPSGIATYSQAGAQFGFSTLWTALFTFPMMVMVWAEAVKDSTEASSTRIRQ